MSNYTRLQKLLEEVPGELGYEYIPLNGDYAQYTTVQIRKLSKKFIRQWKINNSLLFSYPIQHAESEKLKTLFYNDIWFVDGAEIDSINDIKEFISDNLINQDPDTRILSILELIYEGTPFAGNVTNIRGQAATIRDEHWRELFFHTSDEFAYYVRAARDMGYIRITSETNDSYIDVGLTIPGLKAIINIEKEKNSKICFVAMSFDKTLRDVYDQGIFPALKETGFEALRIDDDKTISSDVTINDAMLAAIKKSKFTVADFTQHKEGVYFEAGYALGRGQKVIYTCRTDQINGVHFDTKNYPHIVWEDVEDLKRKLIDKIEVFIKA